jgi:ribonuclease HI
MFQLLRRETRSRSVATSLASRGGAFQAVAAMAVAFLVVAVMAVAIARPALAADDAEKLRQKQAAQEKARLLARELVSGILDLQIRQLEENGLDSQPVLRDIRDMQKHVDTLSAKQMEEVVQLLVKAQEGSNKDRLAHFQSARQRVRDIVVELMSERQKLHRRLQVARVSAQVRQLIGYETKVLTVTKALPDERPERRDNMLVNTLQDQTDVAALYLQLVATLRDLTSWSGDVAVNAAEGLRVLKAAALDDELKGSLTTLQDSKFDAAAAHEEAVIRGLKALLQKLEESRGQVASDREAALKMVREMMKKQEQLREQTRKADLQPPKRDELVQQQQKVQEELGQVAQELEKFPTTQPLLEQAKAASLEATQQIFEEKRAEAVTEQNKVLGRGRPAIATSGRSGTGEQERRPTGRRSRSTGKGPARSRQGPGVTGEGQRSGRIESRRRQGRRASRSESVGKGGRADGAVAGREDAARRSAASRPGSRPSAREGQYGPDR